MVALAAKTYHVNAHTLIATLTCESGLDPDAIGDDGDSLGLAQINLPAHPEVTVAEATDPAFAIEFAAKHFAAGEAHIWTCWRQLTSNQ